MVTSGCLSELPDLVGDTDGDSETPGTTTSANTSAVTSVSDSTTDGTTDTGNEGEPQDGESEAGLEGESGRGLDEGSTGMASTDTSGVIDGSTGGTGGPDDGPGDGSSDGSTGPECGNGDVEPGEQCDDGNNVTEACEYGDPVCTVCNANCENEAGVTSFCGDGNIDADHGEVCDGGLNNGTGPGQCAEDCLRVQSCGDGFRDGTEVCDAGEDNGINGNCDRRCGAPYYLNASAPDGGNGEAWASAFNSFSVAMTALNGNGGGELWVAQGTYAEGTDDFRNPRPSVAMVPYVRMYGGFDGFETAREERDPLAHETIIADGAPNIVAASHVLIDGFTIRGGRLSSNFQVPYDLNGAGVFADSLTDVRVVDCTFEDNNAFDGGSALFFRDSEAVVEGLIIRNNSTGSGPGGPGIETVGGRVEILGTLFTNNSPDLNNGALGARNTELIVRDTDFVAGNAGFNALIDISSTTGTTASFTNVTFADNDQVGGGVAPYASVLRGDDSTIRLTNVSFIRNGETGGSLNADDVVSGAGTSIVNAWVHHSQAVGIPISGGAVVRNSCSTHVDLNGALPPTALDRIPAGGDDIVEYYINPQSECFDIGDNEAATEAGLDFTSQTVHPTGCTDSGLVDAGRHYPPTLASPCG